MVDLRVILKRVNLHGLNFPRDNFEKLIGTLQEKHIRPTRKHFRPTTKKFGPTRKKMIHEWINSGKPATLRFSRPTSVEAFLESNSSTITFLDECFFLRIFFIRLTVLVHFSSFSGHLQVLLSVWFNFASLYLVISVRNCCYLIFC